MNATTNASQPLTGAPNRRFSARTLSAARLRRAKTNRRRQRTTPGVPLTLNRPEQFGNSFRYPDGTWFHCC